MDEVRKSIKMYMEQIGKKINTADNLDENNEENYDYNNADNPNTEQVSDNYENNEKQRLIDLKVAMQDAQIKPYKDEDFLAQIFVSTQEKKDIIDEFRKDLTQFIIKRTRYPRMKIEIIAEYGKEKIVATSPVERFNFLQKISPSITLLKDNFKCEIKY